MHARSTLRPADGITHAYVLLATAWSWAAAAGRARTAVVLKSKAPLVVSLASQELSARAATHDQHLRGYAQPFVPETTSNIWVLTWQRPLKNGPRLYLKCDCRPGLAGRVLTARSVLD